MIELASDERVVSAWTDCRVHYALTSHGNMWWYGADNAYKFRWRRITYDD